MPKLKYNKGNKDEQEKNKLSSKYFEENEGVTVKETQYFLIFSEAGF